MILISILFLIVAIRIMRFVVDRIFNAIHLIKGKADYSESMVYNTESKQLESDGSEITIF